MPTLALILAATLVAHDGRTPSQSLENQVRDARQKLAAHERVQPDSRLPAFEAWDAKHLELQWNAGYALYRLAMTKKKDSLTTEVIRYFNDFIWKRELYLASYHARLILARTHELRGEWADCYRHLRAARLTDDRELRENPEVIDLATRSYIAEFRARARFKKPVKPFLKEVELQLKRFEAKGDSPLFPALRFEIARVHLESSRRNEASQILTALLAAHGQTDLGERALEMLVEHFRRPEHIEMLADRYFEKHYFTQAVVLYRKLPERPRTWLQRGACYKNLRRFPEAIFSLKKARSASGTVGVEAALLLDRVLNHVVKKLQDASYRSELDAHRNWMKNFLDFSKAGPRAIKLMADSLRSDGRFADALELYRRVGADDPGYADVLHSIGYCRYKLKEYEASAKAFRAYLDLGRGSTASTDAALDLACWALLKLDRAEDVLALTQDRMPGEGRFVQWRLAHRVDSLARLGRFAEARAQLKQMNEAVAFSPKVRALERLALGVEAAIRKTGDRKLWGAYARLVVELSEKTHRPLRGEKLLAAADALSLEESPEAFTMALDLYTQFLQDPKLPAQERRDVRIRQAQAAVGAGKLDQARDFVTILVDQEPGNGSLSELLGDISARRAEKLPRGSARNRALKDALDRYGRLAAAFDTVKGEHYYRLLHKWLSVQFTLDPERAAVFFLAKERAGWGEWDEGRWGFREKMKVLRARVFKIVPEGRLRR